MAGQLIEVRFSNVPPPLASPSGKRVSSESIKDWVLATMEPLVPQMWADAAFEFSSARRSMRLEGNIADLKLFSLTILLPLGPWIAAFVEELLWPGSYSTLSSFSTFVEVSLTPLDHAVFRALRLSLGLNHAASLALLEEGLIRALR